MATATKEDAHTVIQLAQLYGQAGIGPASAWIWSDDFVADADEFRRKHPPGSEGNDHVITVGRYFETVATLWKHDLIDEDLLLDWLAVHPIWNRVSGILLAQREQSGLAELWANFERLAEASERAGG